MVFPVIYVPFLPAAGMALFPFILVKKREYKWSRTLIYHEKIHLRQQLELLILPFYFIYVLHYLINLIKYQDHNKAYMNIVFEREAYAMESVPDYIFKRKIWAWSGFFN